jgi:hypothetical protein
MSKLNAKVVIDDSFWIVECNGEKVGTLKHRDKIYTFYDNKKNTNEVVDPDIFNFISSDKKTISNVTVYGYPINTDIAYDMSILDNVPVFKKTANSAVYFAAGYWGILFPMGWRPSFCPKLETLKSYTYIGPFKNEDDMYLAIKRKSQL